ncbi:MAG: glycosyltransferase family 2 protein [Gammaproteobacteria bacterium]|nr:glycosyltransferase family 2 protein [Gammaproteobacteria bacterium]MBV8402972.1 glycosyltransferase family 2 protein [Gammaproteobacteria bacterium]
MRAQRAWALLAPAAVCALLTIWIVLAAANVQTASLSLGIYALANLIVYTDALDLMLRLHVRRRHTATAGASAENRNVSIDLLGSLPGGSRRLVPLRPYAIIASVFNLGDRLDEFIEAFAAYRDRVWVISDGSTDDTLIRLQQAGWRCFDDGINRRKPGALRLLLERLPPHIETVMVIDPDIQIRGVGGGSSAGLERVIGDFQQSGAAAVCPRVLIEPDGFLARFQAYEYALAFRVGRESLADYSITSGVSIYRRDALRRALYQHSLSVYAEDLENAIILLSQGERIYYDGRLAVSTEGPGTIRRWFSQRVGWYHGLLKVYTERLGAIWHISKRTPFAAYHFIVYVGGLSLVLHLVKILSALLLLLSLIGGFDVLFLAHLLPRNTLTSPTYFIGAVGSYLALGVIALFTVVPKSERAYVAPIVPLYLLYALVHLLPMTVGFGNFIALQLWGRRLYQDHYEPGTATTGVWVRGPV